jgi:hypothetical protein
MPFLLKDETANVNVLYIDNLGQLGLMGSANSGQAFSFQGLGIITSGAYFATSLATAGSASSLTGTVVIPISSNGSVGYSVPQVPTVTSASAPSNVSTTAAQWTNSSTNATLTVSYNIW